jgi:hypothetical protein
MKQVILTTVNDDDGTGYALMSELFKYLCFCDGIHGEVGAGGERCFVDCTEQLAFLEAHRLAENDPEHFDITKLLIREVDV